MSANGRLLASEIAFVDGEPLGVRTAAAFNAMVAACRRDTGVRLYLSDGGGYRDLAAQRELAKNPQGPISIATPGSSTHGNDPGAVDINNWRSASEWLAEYADDFGFYRQWASEPWHFMYNGRPVGGGSSASPGSPQNDQEVNMFVPVSDQDSSRWAVVYPDGSSQPLQNADQVAGIGKIAAAAGVGTASLSGSEFDSLGLSNRRGPKGVFEE